MEKNGLKRFSLFSAVILFAAAFACDSPAEIAGGIRKIIISRDALITDYFALGGYGASFFNAGLVLLIGFALVLFTKIPFTGPTMAALFINAGYALWGKNPFNILPILLGTWIYAKMHRVHFGRYIYTALFGTALAPFVTEMVYLLPFSLPVNLLMAIGMGLFIGYLMPPLVTHSASMHMGYNLFNVGFSAGLMAFVLVCIFRSIGIESEPVFIWQEGRPLGMIAGTYLFFGAAFCLGLYLAGGNIRLLFRLFRHPGRAVADFVLMDGPGPTLMNMAAVGSICLTYILLIGGDLSGPVLGAIWMAFGFGAFGAHVKNYLPVLAGVFLSTFISRYDARTPGIQLAALFGVGLAPIAGQFGVVAGILAGMLHSAIVMYTSQMYGGLNLYNNGFSAGFVAIFMVPSIESFMRHYEMRRGKKK